ncbi:uncharacterized protein [Typha latifolia]|uniref:uncharacterized protein n=1 Tax=Typha latifolia TaxID=4733 RepID=UPI003C2C9181
MEWSRNFRPYPYDPSKIRSEGFGSPSQMFSQGLPSSFTSSNPRLPLFFVTSGVRQILNYSFQTGEEFALEFMKDKAESRKPSAPNGNQRGMRVMSHLGLTSQSDMPMLTSEEEVENKETQKMKFLCSFGGRFLPRPSDGKTRYVGGETHILQVSKIMSWQELVLKSKKLYNQVNTIKYRLPDEDLNVLISVSCNEDLHHMFEECSVLQDCEQKPRMFLFSVEDNRDVHFSLKSTDADLERQYLIAVNGMERSGEGSSHHGFPSASGSDFDSLIFEIDCVKASKDDTCSASAYDGQSTGGLMIPSKNSSKDIHENISASFGTHLNNQDHLALHDNGDKHSYSTTHHQDNLYNKVRKFQLPASVPSEFQYTTKREPGRNTASKPLHEPSFSLKYVAEGMQGVTRTQDQEVSRGEVKSIDNVAFRQESEPDKIRYSDRKLFMPTMQLKPSVSNYLQAEVTNATYAPHFVTSSNYSMKHQELEQVSSPIDVNTAKNSQSNEHSKFEVNLCGPPRVFHTESLINLSKSDGSIGSQQLVPNNDHLSAQQSIGEPVDPLPHVEKSDPEHSILLFPDDRSNTKSMKWIWDDPEWRKLLGSSASTWDTDMRVQATGDEITTKSIHSTEPMEDPPTHTCAESYKGGVSQEVSSAFTMASNDTLSDTNNKLVPDVPQLSSKARRSNELSTVKMLHKDDTCASLNSKNHDHRSVNDTMVTNDDHNDNSSLSNRVDEGVSTPCPSTSSRNKVADPLVGYAEQTREEYSSTLKQDADMTQQSHNLSKATWPHWLELDDVSIGLSTVNQPQEVTEDAMAHILGIEDNEPDSGDEMSPEAIDALERDLDLSDLQIIKNEDLEDLRELGSGAFGTVYHGKWRGTDVAIKRIKDICFSYQSSQTDKLTSEFLREADILSRLHHPNVVAFYGVVKDGPGGKLATVTEFMVSGSLKKVLLRKDRYLDRRKRLMLAMDAAIGMEYLHSKDVIHFDLKCDNLLVNLKDQSRPICKVADFGLSRMKLTTMVSGGMRGTLPWMAPELLTINKSKVSEKVDVYSFGIVMWEILTGDEPYADMHTGAVIGGILSNTLRPLVPTSCDVEWRKIMENCWSDNPEQRPSFTQIVIHLRSMLEVCQARSVN